MLPAQTLICHDAYHEIHRLEIVFYFRIAGGGSRFYEGNGWFHAATVPNLERHGAGQ